MPCDTRLKRNQTISQRADEVRKVVSQLDKALATGRAQVRVDRATGAVAFTGLTDAEKDGVTDACAYRRVMISGSALAKAKIAQAEQMAGRGVSRQALATGVHSHDGGQTWHDHKG